MYQHSLFDLEEIFDKPLRRYELFFSILDLGLLEKHVGIGRKPISRAAILRALIFKNLRSITNLSDLSAELYERPRLASILGFAPGDKPVPVERFSSYLKSTSNSILQEVRLMLIRKLIESEVIGGKYLSVDSCPIKANVKENNLKTNVRYRYLKDRPPKNDKDCRIGVFPTFVSGKTKVEFYWGYRNHILNDTQSEMPLCEITLPANVRGTSVIIPQLEFVKDKLLLGPYAVMADSEYDSATIIEYIVKSLGAKPRISKNPRRGAPSTTRLTSSGVPICIAGFEMLSRGIFWDRAQNRKRHKFVCPVKGSKKFAKDHPYCPWFHPRFLNGTGCYRYLRVDVDETIRGSIDYGSEAFKRDFNRRSSSERGFSRLLSILMQKPSVIGLAATANLCTISHITVLAIAYFSSFVKEPDKIRFVKSFLPNF
tara:strand:- start:115 stop:1395 length:1281 start_codon:yes stop_codon:yes gene_type:complete